MGEIRIEVRGARVIGIKLNTLAKSFRSHREPITRSAKQVANPSIGEGFITQRPEWEPLDESTIQKKGHAQILIDSGRGARAATALARWEFDRHRGMYNVTTFPASSRYMKWHHFGTEDHPQRIFAQLTLGDERQIGNVFKRWTAEKIRESGLK